MTFRQRQERASHLRAIPLESVLPLCGAAPDRHDKRKWHTPAGVLSITGPKFMNWTLGAGGGGAIDLVIQLLHLDFKASVDWLERHFPGAPAPQPLSPTSQPRLSLPTPDPGQLGRVHRYLVAQRRLPPALIDPLIQSGALYADARANAVFLLLGKQNTPVGAELRGTTQRPWRGLAPGSHKDLGCFAIPACPQAQPDIPLPAIILCESAIDAISCLALHPRHLCLSTAGARPNPLWLAPLIQTGAQVYCGFDADPAGDDMAQAMFALHPTVKRLRPSQHDWNDVLSARR